MEKINAPMKIDITTGDSITPNAIQYEYPLIFENKSVPIMAYSLETILAEKYETIIRRNIGTTRARDYYDLHMLYHKRKEEICIDVFRDAVLHTSKTRGSLDEIYDWQEILKEIRETPELYKLWDKYKEYTPYADEYDFSDMIRTVEEVAELLAL